MTNVTEEHTTPFKEKKMVNDLRSSGPDRSETVYSETWDFTDNTHLVWKPLHEPPDGLKEEMGGTCTSKQGILGAE